MTGEGLDGLVDGIGTLNMTRSRNVNLSLSDAHKARDDLLRKMLFYSRFVSRFCFK